MLANIRPVIYISLIALLSSCTSKMIPVEEIKDQISLLPSCQDSSNYYDKQLTRMVSSIPEQKHKEAALKSSFENWKFYEDEYLSFYYPDDQNIKLEIKTPKSKIPVMGGRVGDTEDTFFRSYRLALGEKTYCLLMLDKTNNFDDGICWCGAVEFQKYLYYGGTFFRYDLLENGYVKKIQALSKNHRVVAMEWTHLPIKQDPYISIASSVRLKDPIKREVIEKKVREQYGELGLLYKGMTQEQIIKLMGAPTKLAKNKLIYKTTINDENEEETYIDTLTIEFNHKGYFKGLKPNWYTSQKLSFPPKRGSVNWISEIIGQNLDEDGAPVSNSEFDYDLGLLTDKNIAYIFKKFTELAPKASEDDFNSLCWAIYVLAKGGHKSSYVVPIIKERYKSGITPHCANRYIAEFHQKEMIPLFTDQVQKIYKEAEVLHNKDKTLSLNDLYNLDTLYTFLGDDVEKLIIQGMKHPNPEIRYAAFFNWYTLPFDVAINYLKTGLKDSSYEVRKRCARAFSKHIGSKEDLPYLQTALKSEKNKKVKKLLDVAIKRLSKEKSAEK